MSGWINREIGQRYLVKERLGEGAHGTVFRVWDAVRSGEFALKRYKDDALDVQAAEAARHFQLIDSQAILPILEVHPEFAEGQVTVMPLMEGTLADQSMVLASHAVESTRRILTALDFVHRRGTVHGDVKPSNAFRDARRSVLLGDFGVRGHTVEYASPERVDGADADIAADLWATAVLFYELLCGALPFGSRPQLEAEEIAVAVRAARYAHPDAHHPYLPLRFRNFFKKCFCASPSDRAFTTAAAMHLGMSNLSVGVEWVRLRRADKVVCFEGHELSSDARRTGVRYEASVEALRGERYAAVVRKASVGGDLRRVRKLPPFEGTKAQAGQRLRVWMRTLMESGELERG